MKFVTSLNQQHIEKNILTGSRIGTVILFVFLLLSGYRADAQLIVREDIPLEELVRKHFIGEGARVSNIVRRGWPRAMGHFNGKSSNIGVDEGILLTSGWVGVAVGPNDVEDASFPAFSAGDPDLRALTNRITFDASVLEFDFVSYQDTVSFEYVFASEEYQEYVGSPYNDIFAFFISGPGIPGKKNIALLPGSALPVAINNVNHLLNTHLYVDNALGPTVQYDGFTRVLKAMAVVTPCETYRLKLAITDVQDDVLDSGVFLKKGSFNAGDVFEVRGLRDGYETGCLPGMFEILRSGEINKPLTVTFQLLGDATPGSDYTPITTTVTFQAGQTSMLIPVNAKNDTIPDNGEMVILYIPDFCNTGLVRDTVYIWEVAPLTLTIPDDTLLCEGSDLLLSATIGGGTGTYFYEWEGFAQGDSILALSPAVNGLYRFSVTDTLTGCKATKEIKVLLDALPIADAGPDKSVCIGYSMPLGAPATGGSPPYRYEWTPPEGLDNPTIATPTATPSGVSTWVVKVTSAMGCVDYDTVTVEVSDVRIDAGNDSLICRGTVVAIGGDATGGTPPYTYAWSPSIGLTSVNIAQPLAKPDTSTTYIVRATDRNGCEAVDSVHLVVSWITLDAGPDALICPGERVTIGRDAQWSHSPVTYSWDPAIGMHNQYSSTPSVRPPRDMTYVVTATNGAGCVATDTVSVFISSLSADAGPDQTMCPGESVPLAGSAIGGRGPYSIRWSPSIGLTSTDILTPTANPDTSTWYHLRVLDQDGCVYTDSVRITVFPRPTLKIQASGPTVLCTGDSLSLDAGTIMSSIKWSTGAATRTIRVGAEGRYWCEGMSADGCRSLSDTVLIQVTDKPQPIIAGPVTVCEGQEVRYSVGDAGSALYRWLVTGGFIVNGGGTREITVRWDASGTYSVAIEVVLGSAFCRGDTLITVLVLPTPRPFLLPAGPVTVCPGDSITLQAPEGFATYTWTTGASGSRIVVSAPGTYAVTVSSAGGCIGTSPEVEVLLYPAPTPRLRFLTPRTVCEGDSVIVEIEGDFAAYAWNTGATGKRITVRTDALVWADVRSPEGCAGLSDTAQVRIAPAPRPLIVANGPLEFCEGDSVVLRTSEMYETWNWSMGSSSASIIVRSSGMHSVSVTNTDGCNGIASPVEVRVHPIPPEPIITQISDRLHGPAGYSYQWYIEDGASFKELSGETAESMVFEFGTRYRVRIATQFGCTALSPPFIVPMDELAMSTVGLPILEAVPGQHLVIPLSLISQNYLTEAGVASFSATIRFNSSMLSPTGSTPMGRLDGTERVIDLTGPFLEGSAILSDPTFIATLGNAPTTPLTLEYFAWNNGNVRVTRIDGRLDMPVCREGTERLLDGTGRLRLAQNHPNPFNSMTVIEYEVIERGYTQLYVLDALGRRVATLFEESVEPGAYRTAFDASTLPSGLYWSVLKTPTQLVTRPMRLVK